MNGDGIRDLVSGSWPGEIYLMAGRADGTFAEPQAIKDAQGKDINVDFASAVVVEDWDRDGDLDMTVGTFHGYVFFIAQNNGQFDQAVKLESDGKHLEHHHGGPELVDWDGNGTIDLLIAEGEGGVTFYPNQTDKGMPQLGAGIELIPSASGSQNAPGRRTKLDVADYNNDGKLDLLMGDWYNAADEAPELTEADEIELEQAEAAMVPLNKELAQVLKDIQAACLKEMDMTAEQVHADRDASKRLYELLVSTKQSSPEFQSVVERMDKHVAVLKKFNPRADDLGRVWVFLGKTE